MCGLFCCQSFENEAILPHSHRTGLSLTGCERIEEDKWQLSGTSCARSGPSGRNTSEVVTNDMNAGFLAQAVREMTASIPWGHGQRSARAVMSALVKVFLEESELVICET